MADSSGETFDALRILAKGRAWSERNEAVCPFSRKYIGDITNAQALLEPFTHINAVPGKDIRGLMLAAFNKWLEVPADKLDTITRVVGMLHTASLL